MAEKEYVHLDKNNTCPECGRDYGRGATHCKKCTIDESRDPLVAAAAQYLTEASSFSAVLYDVLAKARQFQPSERIQIAAAILNSAARTEGLDTAVKDKLLNHSAVLDRLANGI